MQGACYAHEIEHALGVISKATELVAPQSQSGHSDRRWPELRR